MKLVTVTHNIRRKPHLSSMNSGRWEMINVMLIICIRRGTRDLNATAKYNTDS